MRDPPGPGARRRVLLTILVFLAGATGASAQPVAAPSPVLTGPSEAMRRNLVEAYRLRLDHRLLLAVREIRALADRATPEAPVVEFVDGGWRIRHAGLDVGRLPDRPDFADLVTMLSRFADRFRSRAPAPAPPSASAGDRDLQARLHQFAAPALFETLRRIDAGWRAGRREATLALAATRALVWLAFQSLDRAEIADAVPAKALALLAWTRTVTGDPLLREEALLAAVMGYAAHAARIGASLPPTDAVRLYVTRDDEHLERLAAQPGATVEARCLWLSRLGHSRDVEAWHRFRAAALLADDLVLPVMKTALELHDFDTTGALSGRLLPAVLHELARGSGEAVPRTWRERAGSALGSAARVIARMLRWLGAALAIPALGALAEQFESTMLDVVSTTLEPGVGELLDRVESRLDALAAQHAGPFLDAATHRDYYRGYALSGVLLLGRHLLDARSAGAGAERLAETLGRATQSPGADLARWYDHLVGSKSGRLDPQSLLEDLGGLPSLGPAPLERTVDELRARLGFLDPRLVTAVRHLAARLDTRLSHRRTLADLAYGTLFDLRLADELYRDVVNASGGSDPSFDAWFADRTGDVARLATLLRTPTVAPMVRAEALGYLANQGGLAPEEVRREFGRLVDEAPDSWPVRAKQVAYLEQTRRYAEARDVITPWLQRHGREAGFDYIFARTALARMYGHEGRFAEGLALVEPLVKTGQAGAMERAAVLLDAVDRRDEAERTARDAVAGYPDLVRTRTLLAELYWRHGKAADAARVLREAPHALTLPDWQFTVTPRFGEVFRDRPPDETLRAFSALLSTNVDAFSLQRLAFSMADAGRHELAFRMVSQLRGSGLGQLVFHIDAYRHLKAWQGRDAALAWLRTAVPNTLVDAVGTVAFDQDQLDLLWHFISEPRGRHADFDWLLRAAATLRLGGPNEPPQREALLRHYRDRAPGHYHALGRFLLRLEPEDAVLALATDGKKRCEIAYYLGIRAEADRRYPDASDWYRVAVETGLVNNGEYRWAFNALYRWQSSGKSLARLQR